MGRMRRDSRSAKWASGLASHFCMSQVRAMNLHEFGNIRALLQVLIQLLETGSVDIVRVLEQEVRLLNKQVAYAVCIVDLVVPLGDAVTEAWWLGYDTFD